MAMSAIASGKNRELLFIATCFTNSDISACCFTGVSGARHPENRKILIPSKKPHFRYGKKISSPRERRKWSLDVGQHLKGASPDVRTESRTVAGK